MRKLTAALLLSFAMNTHAASVSQPYTFDYFVHAESGPKPDLIFGTGQTTFIQLADDVEVQRIVVRKGQSEKVAEIYFSAPYTVVKEFFDSMKVMTNKGEFTVQRTGAKTEVELAAERAEAAQKERDAVQAKAKEQAAEIVKLREEIKAQKEVALKAAQAEKTTADGSSKVVKNEAGEAAMSTVGRVETAAVEAVDLVAKSGAGDSPVTPTATKIEQKTERAVQLAKNHAGGSAVSSVLSTGAKPPRAEAAAPSAVVAANDAKEESRVTFFIRNGEGLRSALAREAQKLGMNVSWSLREDRVASRDMTFAGDTRDAVLNDILVAFRLPGYLVASTNTLYIVKDEK